MLMIAGMNQWILLWLILTVAFVVGEIASVGLTSIWFAAGSLCALIVAGFGGGLGIQIIVFLVVSFALLFATRPWAKKYINAKMTKTNVAEHVGKVIVISETVDNEKQTGMAVVNGQEWTIRSEEDGIVIAKGKKAIVTRISGVKLMVREYKED